MGSQPSPLDNWIVSYNTYIYKTNGKKKLHRFGSTKKDYILITIIKMNDLLNMDSTIAGSMNARS